MGKGLRMFMWGYQPHFRSRFENWTKDVLKEAGTTLDADAQLVGVRRSGSEGLPVCIEPEEGSILEADFLGLLDELPERTKNHPDQQMIYGDGPRMRDKPENIRRKVTYQAVVNRLARADERDGTSTVVGGSVAIDKYDVFPVLRFERAAWEAHLPLKTTLVEEGYSVVRSFSEAVVGEILGEATEALASREPGRLFDIFQRDNADVLRSAGRRMMYVPSWAAKDLEGVGGLFDHCNIISSFPYEGTAGNGKLVVSRKGHPAVDALVILKNPVAISDNRWARKVLQVASGELALLSDSANIYGLGRLDFSRYDASKESAFTVDFLGHYKWVLWHNATALMRVEYGVPRLPSVRISENDFKSAAGRILAGTPGLDLNALWNTIIVACEQRHGTMVVVSAAAPAEAERLTAQATPIEPILLNSDTIRRVTGIDGAMLLDPSGVCHAIGVILDGLASPGCTPSRGARYNSAIRYIESAKAKTLAVVISEDGQVNLFPSLMPRIQKSVITELIAVGKAGVEAKDFDRIRRSLNGLSKVRFYLSDQDAEAANAILTGQDSIPSEVGEIRILYGAFEGNPECDDSYFVADAEGG